MHPRKGITTEHCRHNDGGPDLADPEARARLVDDMLEDLRHTYVGTRGDVFLVFEHQGGDALAGVFKSASDNLCHNL